MKDPKYKIKLCRCCSSQITAPPLLTYNNMPGIAQNFPDENSLDADQGITFAIYQCQDCGLLQIVQEPVYYYKDVIRAIAVSEDMKSFRSRYFADFVRSCGLRGKKIIEIGAGAGEYMQIMAENDVQVYGLEHRRESVMKAQDHGLRVFEGYIENSSYKIPQAPYDGFYIMNFLEHIPDPKAFLKGIAFNLADGAYGLVEVPNTDFILENKMFSEFMLDHLSYFTKNTLRVMLETSGFEVLSCQVVWNDYILSAIVRKRKYLDVSSFETHESKLILWLNGYLDEMHANGRKVAIWGAGHQALAIMALADLKDKVECVIDSAAFKQNKYTPASHIPIYGPDKIRELGIGAILVMAGSYSDEVCAVIQKNYQDVWVKKLEEA